MTDLIRMRQKRKTAVWIAVGTNLLCLIAKLISELIFTVHAMVQPMQSP